MLTPVLESLYISGCEKLTNLPKFSRITKLMLPGCTINSITNFPEVLYLYLEHITHLSFDGTDITDLQISKISSNSPKLLSLSLGRYLDPLHNSRHCQNIQNPTLNCKTVEVIDFVSCVNLRNTALVTL